MRRVIGFTLAGLGAFLVVAAVLTRTYVGGQLIKFPLNEYVKTTLLAKNTSYFSPALVKSVTWATIQVTDTVKGDAKAGTSSTTVWNEFTYLYDLTNRKEYAVSTRRAAFDRRTAQLVNCCGANVNGNSTIRQTGVSGYVFPIGTQSRPTTCSTPASTGPCRSATQERARSTASRSTASWSRCRPPRLAPRSCRERWSG